MLEGGRGKASVEMPGERGGSSAVGVGMRLRVFSVLLKAMDCRVRSAREGRVGGREGLLNSDISFRRSCFDGSRLIGEADAAGSAKLWALST